MLNVNSENCEILKTEYYTDETVAGHLKRREWNFAFLLLFILKF